MRGRRRRGVCSGRGGDDGSCARGGGEERELLLLVVLRVRVGLVVRRLLRLRLLSLGLVVLAAARALPPLLAPPVLLLCPPLRPLPPPLPALLPRDVQLRLRGAVAHSQCADGVQRVTKHLTVAAGRQQEAIVEGHGRSRHHRCGVVMMADEAVLQLVAAAHRHSAAGRSQQQEGAGERVGQRRHCACAAAEVDGAARHGRVEGGLVQRLHLAGRVRRSRGRRRRQREEERRGGVRRVQDGRHVVQPLLLLLTPGRPLPPPLLPGLAPLLLPVRLLVCHVVAAALLPPLLLGLPLLLALLLSLCRLLPDVVAPLASLQVERVALPLRPRGC